MAAVASNRILSSLPARILAVMKPHLRPVEMRFGDRLAEAGVTVKRVYFPQTGAISLVVPLSAGDLIETAMVGRDGVLNAASALDGKRSMITGIVQVAGTASWIDVNRLRAIADEHKALRALVIRHEQVVLAQCQQSAACNASHTVEDRMCRWLSRMRDLAEDDNLELTQDFLSRMLGVRRASVSTIANSLKEAGLIVYSRGRIRVRNRKKLKLASCECYAAVKANYDTLI